MSLKRNIGWTFAGLALFLIVLIVVGYFYLQTNSFRRFAIREIVKQADQATGGRTEIGGMDFKLSDLTAHLYNITVRGTEGPDQPPLLHADKLTVRAKIVSALHRQISLRRTDHSGNKGVGEPVTGVIRKFSSRNRRHA